MVSTRSLRCGGDGESHVSDAARFGKIETGLNGKLRRFVEKHPDEGLIDTGSNLLRPGLFAEPRANGRLSFENKVFTLRHIRCARALVHTVSAPFRDISTPGSFSVEVHLIQRNRSAIGLMTIAGKLSI